MTGEGLSMAVADERAWFAEEIDGLLPSLYGTALRLAGNEADAEDLVADAVAKAWSRLDSLDSRDRFDGWLFRILTNTFLSGCRTAARRGAHESLDELDDFSLFEKLHTPVLLWWGNPEQAFLNRLLREDLQHALRDVPPAFRAAVVMADVHGFTYQEIADTMDVPIGTVRSRLARGRALMQKALWEHARDAGIAGTTPEPGKAEP